MNANPIIVALDVDSAEQARTLVRRIGAEISFYKVGLELYCAAGNDFVRELQDNGKDVFLDLKFYDIGETVNRAVSQVARTGVRFLSIHASGAVMRAAVDGRGDSPLRLLAVTVLTSFERPDLDELGYSREVSELVSLLARSAVTAGVDGLISSPLEAASVRAIAGPNAILVTPGVRSSGAGKGDQKRVATPAEALRAGANYVVIGRRITRAADPATEVARVLEEISAYA